MKSELQPALTGGVYLNFLEGQESTDRTRDAYSSDNFRRLSALKAAYDPENRLNCSFAIFPEAERADREPEADHGEKKRLPPDLVRVVHASP
jgi:hypothetical protein